MSAVTISTPRRAPTMPRPLLPLWAACLVALAAAPLMDLAYPEVGWWPAAFIATPMVLLTLIGRGAWSAFLVSGVFAGAFTLLHIVWISRYLGPVPWIALTALETLLFAAASIPIALAYRWLPRLTRGRWARLVALPSLVAGLWIMRELFLGSWPYTGFPWVRIGMSQSESPLAPAASWLGVNGLGFAIVFVIAAAIELARMLPTSLARRTAPAALPALVVAIGLVVVPLYPTTVTGSLKVGAVQGNGPSGYFDHRTKNAIIQAQLDATAPIVDDDLDLLVWPEGLDSDPLANPATAATLNRLTARIDAPMILNAAITEGELIYNTSVLWMPGTGAVAHHAKRNPVPMGEYVPDRWFYEALAPDLIGLIGREYTPGTDAPFFDVNGVGVGLAICFDVIYDDVIWEGIADGAQLEVFQTNNADFRDTDENLQQLSFARMRAVETGRTVVNISTVGTSQFIAADGSTIDQLPTGVAGAMVGDLELRDGTTLAVVIGPAVRLLLGLGSPLALIACGVLARLRQQKTQGATSGEMTP